MIWVQTVDKIGSYLVDSPVSKKKKHHLHGREETSVRPTMFGFRERVLDLHTRFPFL